MPPSGQTGGTRTEVTDMAIHSRWITVGVATGLLALMGASLLHAQPQQRRDTLQTGAVTQADTGQSLEARPDGR